MGGVQTLIFLGQSGNDEVKVSSYRSTGTLFYGHFLAVFTWHWINFQLVSRKTVCLGIPFTLKHLNCTKI